MCPSEHLPSPPKDFYNRTQSDRFDASLAPKHPVVVRNATILTGEVAEGLEIVFGDVLLDKGIIKAVGKIGKLDGEVEEIQAHGAWVTAGIVDLHSHMGDDASPALSGSSDTNSRSVHYPAAADAPSTGSYPRCIIQAVYLGRHYDSSNPARKCQCYSVESVPHQAPMYIREAHFFNASGIAIQITIALEAPENEPCPSSRQHQID
ncbi:hypothetical protein AAF712_012703 [Marasmius tenuissimus]|uniref:Amidohydrolase-related domain-containing protein n=1 Tax=Marasmius tenuissimus TaxID=585030 RepID=A0ABR2ZIF5_9AGAR